MCDPVTAIVGSTLASVAMSAYQGSQQSKAADKAGQQAQMNADKTAKQADEAYNRANGKSPNTQNLLDENLNAALSGSAGTMLTGPGGIDPSLLSLGKNNLLGA